MTPTRIEAKEVPSDHVPSLVLYGREGCHLCEDALGAILALRESGLIFEFAQIDIDNDDELHKRFLERIPVVEIDGLEIAELEIDSLEVKDAIERAATIAPDDSDS